MASFFALRQNRKNEQYPWSKKKCLLGDHVPRLEFHPILHQQDRVLEPHGLRGDCCPAVPL